MTAPVLTKEQVNEVRGWSCDCKEMREDLDALADSHEALRAERDALAAKVAELEGKALAYDDAHQGDFHERAHKLARWDAKDIGRNVWHIAVERAEKAEAKVAVLRSAWPCPFCNGMGSVGPYERDTPDGSEIVPRHKCVSCGGSGTDSKSADMALASGALNG